MPLSLNQFKIHNKLILILFIQFIIISINFISVDSISSLKWVVSYILLVIILKNVDLISPLAWLMTIWNIIFINAYSGIIIYHSPIDYSALLYLSLTLFVFAIGYFLPFNDKNKHVPLSFKIKLSNKESIITIILAYMGIIGGIFIFIDIIILSGGNINNLSALRLLIGTREVSIFGQLAAILLSGSFFSLVVLLIFKFKNQIILILSVVGLATGSIVSAGRQNIFQIFLVITMVLLIKFKYHIKTKLSPGIKIIGFSLIGIIIVYLIVLSATRDVTSMDKNKMVGYTKTNNLSYSDDFSNLMNKLPIEASNFIADFTFYFSEEIIVYSDAYRYKTYPIINIDFLQFFPFFERQLHKLGLRKNTLELRMNKLWEKHYETSVFNSAWGTSMLTLLKCFGYLGGILIVFLHGLFSRYIYSSFLRKPELSTILALIVNNIILFYTAITPVTQEISFMFFVFISFYFFFRKKVNFGNKEDQLYKDSIQISS